MILLRKKFTVKQSETGPLEWILGARVRRNMAAGTTSIDQEIAIKSTQTIYREAWTG